MKKYLLTAFCFLSTLAVFSQDEDAWVYLADKPDVATALANPSSILSQEAIDRKTAHGTPIDERDVPVDESYITQLKNQTGITVLAKSKWMNAVHVRGTQTDIDALETLAFVDSIEFADQSLNTAKTVSTEHQNKFQQEADLMVNYDYGSAQNQINMFNGQALHEADYTGTDITVAVIDAGFPDVNTMGAFSHVFTDNRLLGTYDFVQRDIDVYTNTSSSHGTLVLSTMAGMVDNEYTGTAPDASYYLFITEHAPSENPVEESYWVEAVERADSLGVDVVNTSLGYSTFDNSNYSYSPSDMDGETAFITRGANIAFEKGLLLVNSAGNSGGSSWNIVTAPADSDGVLTVGAVDSNGDYASFSSQGSTDQPSQKPDVVVQGQASAIVYTNGVVSTANGTSFSSPILAGAVACLWQALPDLTNANIMQLVRESASQYNNPDFMMGYGIPNFLTIVQDENLNSSEGFEKENLHIYPNPAKNTVHIRTSISEIDVEVFDILGKQVLTKHKLNGSKTLNVSSLKRGVYLLKLSSGDKMVTRKLVKE